MITSKQKVAQDIAKSTTIAGKGAFGNIQLKRGMLKGGLHGGVKGSVRGAFRSVLKGNIMAHSRAAAKKLY